MILQIPADHVIVVLGAAGDLARRKLLPALFHLAVQGWLPRRFCVIGSGREELADDEFRDHARQAVDQFGRCPAAGASWDAFAETLSYVPGEFGPDSASPLAEAVQRAERGLGGEPGRLFYLAVPPPAFAPITEGIGAAGLGERARVVYEKPFGLDLDSARALNQVVHGVLAEKQVFRIDHFLGKETVQNILALRFANGMFEPVWNRDHVDHVQIEVPETLGVGTRAGFYEQTGALRDMLVTHLFQVLSFVAMEPPVALDAHRLVDEKTKVFAAAVPLSPRDVVRGQYDGYRREEGVAPDSTTETFVAARLCVDSWRWAGVPFFLRTGKRLAADRRTVTIAFREPPRRMFAGLPPGDMERNHLTLELGAPEGISATFLAKVPGPSIELGEATMTFRYEGAFGSPLVEAYERLLHDVLIGDHTLFTRADAIERAWEIVAPVLADPPPIHMYAPGSWGPKTAGELVAPHRRWLGC